MGMTNGAVLAFENSGQQVDFSSWSNQYQGWSARDGVRIQTVQMFLWLVIGAYLEAVAPREYGRPLKPWFMFLPSFWRPK
jgi:hypothetical protein